ncbi:MAG: hypothetical protein R3C01_01065 [Planctomycetaceae bacterium]
MRQMLFYSLFSLTLLAAGTSSVEAGLFGCLKPAGCQSYDCNHSCYPTIKQEKVEKDCFSFEEKVICVPPIRFPWHTCCDTGVGGGVRCVRKLTKKKVECGTKDVWEWNVRDLCGGSSCKPACGSTMSNCPCGTLPLSTHSSSTQPQAMQPLPTPSAPPMEPAPVPMTTTRPVPMSSGPMPSTPTTPGPPTAPVP